MILVVGSSNSDIPYDVHSAAWVMFGRPGLRMVIDPKEIACDPEPTRLDPGKLQAQVNRGVSASALLRRFNPTAWRLRSGGVRLG